MRVRPRARSIVVLLLVFVAVASTGIAWNVGNRAYRAVSRLGGFEIGGAAPDIPGDNMAHPYGVVPPARFYVYLRHPDVRNAQCVYDECGRGGEIVATLRGWLHGSGLDDFNRAQLRLPRATKSFMLVADANAVTVGIYPNTDMADLPNILRKHPDLADFGMLEGVRQLGPLAVGAPLPFKPTNMFTDVTAETQKKPEFYVYVVHETVHSGEYCPYYECGAYIDMVYQAGGAFDAFDHDDPEIIKKFGLSPHQVARGEVTLVVVADADGKIVSIHPNKDMRDIMTILTQHPELADVRKLYPIRVE